MELATYWSLTWDENVDGIVFPSVAQEAKLVGMETACLVCDVAVVTGMNVNWTSPGHTDCVIHGC